MSKSWLFVLATLLAPTASGFADTAAEQLLKKPIDWFRDSGSREALENILSWQTENGDWPKNTDTTAPKKSAKRDSEKGTFDNGATTGELRVLAKAFGATNEERFKLAFIKGFDHILRAQYPNGGWPQHFPIGKDYHRHITFNDNSMIRLLEFLTECTVRDDYLFLDADRRDAATTSIQRGVDCIVRCQVVVDGKATAWCAQHDADTLAPAQARSYELPSLSGAESAGVLRFLMRLSDPRPEVIESVRAGVDWFETVKISGYRYDRKVDDPVLVEDSDAAPMWARFYEIGSNRPMFSDRDGVVKYDISEVGLERRRGYSWYGTWGKSVFSTYAKWKYR